MSEVIIEGRLSMTIRNRDMDSDVRRRISTDLKNKTRLGTTGEITALLMADL